MIKHFFSKINECKYELFMIFTICLLIDLISCTKHNQKLLKEILDSQEYYLSDMASNINKIEKNIWSIEWDITTKF